MAKFVGMMSGAQHAPKAPADKAGKVPVDEVAEDTREVDDVDHAGDSEQPEKVEVKVSPAKDDQAHHAPKAPADKAGK